MGGEFKDFGVAGALANSRSIQGVVRVLNLFGSKYPGTCSVVFTRKSEEGVEIDFGASDAGSASHGINDFMKWLDLTDRLMLLEAMIANLRDRRADGVLIEDLIKEAHTIIETLYPGLEVAGVDPS